MRAAPPNSPLRSHHRPVRPHSTEPSFAGSRPTPLPCSTGPSADPPTRCIAIFEYELFVFSGTLNASIYREGTYGQFAMVSVGRPHLVIVHGQLWSGWAWGLGCPTEGEAPALGSGLSREPGRPWPVGAFPRCPGLCSLVGVNRSVTALCGDPVSVPSVSVSLHGFLTLTNIALGLFKLNFFSLRKTKQSHSIQWRQKLSQAGAG